jgi:hypothetical protein
LKSLMNSSQWQCSLALALNSILHEMAKDLLGTLLCGKPHQWQRSKQYLQQCKPRPKHGREESTSLEEPWT